jgi:hypothetical protein
MHDDDMRHEFHDFLDGVAAVFVDVGDQVGRRQLSDHIELGVLGAADLGHPAQRCARMDAEAGAADQAFDQTEVADEFGQARHQADDARHAGKAPVLAAERIDQRLIPQPLLQEKG